MVLATRGKLACCVGSLAATSTKPANKITLGESASCYCTSCPLIDRVTYMYTVVYVNGPYPRENSVCSCGGGSLIYLYYCATVVVVQYRQCFRCRICRGLCTCISYVHGVKRSTPFCSKTWNAIFVEVSARLSPRLAITQYLRIDSY